jgi:hypothetical protein
VLDLAAPRDDQALIQSAVHAGIIAKDYAVGE